MKKTLILFLACALLLSACAAAPDVQTTPEPTPIPTATPVPTPSPELAAANPGGHEAVEVEFCWNNDYVKTEDTAQSLPSVWVQLRGLDENGNQVWEYTSSNYPVDEDGNPLLSEIGVNGSLYYLLENREILAFDRATGNLLWKNGEYGGALPLFLFGTDGTLYLCDADSPDLFVVDSQGRTVIRQDKLCEGYETAYRMLWQEGKLAVWFEKKEGEDTDASWVLYVDPQTFEVSSNAKH